jgi:UDP-N-acetylglucosamine 4,6-dehydratase
MFDGKRILITGGTGSFGHTVARALLRESKAEEIRILSRDEKKQHDMRLDYGNNRKPEVHHRRCAPAARAVLDAMDGVDFRSSTRRR